MSINTTQTAIHANPFFSENPQTSNKQDGAKPNDYFLTVGNKDQPALDQQFVMNPLFRENPIADSSIRETDEKWNVKHKSDCTLYSLRTEDGQVHCRIIFDGVKVDRRQFEAAALDIQGQNKAVGMLNANDIVTNDDDSIAYTQELNIKDPMGIFSIGKLSDRVELRFDDSDPQQSAVILDRVADGGSALGSVESGTCIYNHQTQEMEISFVIDLGDTKPMFLGMKPIDLPERPVQDVLEINALSYARDLKKFLENF